MVTYRVPSTLSDGASDVSSTDWPDDLSTGTPSRSTYRVPSTPSDASSYAPSTDPLGQSPPAATPVARYNLRSRTLQRDGALIMLREPLSSVPSHSLRSRDTSPDNEALVWPTGSSRSGRRSADRESSGGLTDETALSDTERAAPLLFHENIVPLGHGFEDQDFITLDQLIRSQQRQSGLPTSRKFQGLPEPVVWHTLISLLKAVTYLHSGMSGVEYRSQERQAGWQPIVHNLINPADIFLRRPEPGAAVPYGGCRVGNSNRCIVLPHDPSAINDDETRANRKRAFQGLHDIGEETGYEAPEIVSDFDDVPGPGSDLWSIGGVLIAMMTGSDPWNFVLEIRFLEHLKRGFKRSEIYEDWRNVSVVARRALLLTMAGHASIALALPRRYSADLRMVTEALLFVHPESRLTAREVLLDAEVRWEMLKAGLDQADTIGDGSGENGTVRAGKAIARYQEEARLARDMLGDDQN